MSSLAISQPGPINLKFSYRPVIGTKQQQLNTVPPKTIAMYVLTVLEDPEVKYSAPCVFVFMEGTCPIGTYEDDWIAEYPWVRGYIYMYINICMSI
jgi:hypothetical protein